MDALDSLAFDDLKLFVRIAALGTLSAVARERDVQVSQVSRALTRIETTCGARLLHRSTHGLALTPEGGTFLDYARRLVGTLDELEGEFARRTAQPSGRVRVAASTVVAKYLLLPSLQGLHARHPRLQVELEVSDRLADLARDGIDIAIRTTREVPEQLVARPLGQLGRALYAAPDYVARSGLPARPEDLARHQLVTNSAATHLNSWPFLIEGRRVSWPADGDWRTNDTGLAADMVLAGLGIGRLAALVGDPLVRSGQLVRVLPEFVDAQPVPMFAVLAQARQRLPKIRACLDWWGDWFAGR